MAFKMNGSPAKMGTISGTTGHSSALKMKAASALKQETDYEAMQKESTKKDPRYGKLTAEEYKTEVLRQSTSKKSGKGYDAMGVYDYKGDKKEVKTDVKTEVKTEPVVSAKDATKRKEGVKRDSIIGDENKDGNMLTRGLKKVFKKASPEKIAQRKADKTEAKKQGISVWLLKKNRKSPVKDTVTPGSNPDSERATNQHNKFHADGWPADHKGDPNKLKKGDQKKKK